MRPVSTILGLIALGAGSRLVPHLPNMTAMSAVSARSFEQFGARGLLIPLSALLLSDAIIGFYDWRLLLSVYLSFGLVSVIVRNLRMNTSVSVAALSGSITFFLVTNTIVWATSSWYPPNALGLLAAYGAGLPFLISMALGDVVFAHIFLRKTQMGHLKTLTPNGVEYTRDGQRIRVL